MSDQSVIDPAVKHAVSGEMARTFRVGTHERRGVFVEIRLRNPDSDHPDLSITGHTQWRPHVWYDAGQIVEVLDDCKPYGAWTRESLERLAFVWRLYHLNDMQAGCEHQRLAGWTYNSHPSAPCPVCGYRMGTAWRRMDLPADVLILVQAWLGAEDPALV